jgi:transcriptional regulator with GAF, ATPase, and Fis domain
MSEALSSQGTVDHEVMWRCMLRLLDRVYGVMDGESVADDCLDILVDVLGADRGLMLQTMSDGGTRVVNARGQKKALRAEEREEVSRTLVRRALETRGCIVWDPLSNATASASLSSLGIVAAFATPLFGGVSRDAPRGVLYVDFRDRRKLIEARHVEFFAAAATLFGAVLEQHERGTLAREHLREAEAHCTDARRAPSLDDLLGFPSMQDIRDEVESARSSRSPILILGESGTGKTLLAHSIAEASGFRPIVRAVLGSSEDLNTITSELFGHERGAYSGALGRRIGLVEFAQGGTILLDEIASLPAHAQQLLLDFTQFGTYRPLGHDRAEPKRANVRIIASTNGDLATAVREKRFRQDLYFRLAAVTLHLPPLRARREDIPVLAEGTLRRVDPGRPWSLSVPLRRLLVSPGLEWAGNVRQLEHAIARAVERALRRDPQTTLLTPEHLEARDLGVTIDAAEVQRPQAEALDVAWQSLQAERGRIDEREQEVIRRALQGAGGVVAQAARELGLARTTLASRIEALQMAVPRRRHGTQE